MIFRLFAFLRRTLRAIAAFLLLIPAPAPQPAAPPAPAETPEQQPAIFKRESRKKRRKERVRWWQKARCHIVARTHTETDGHGHYAVFKSKADFDAGKKPWRKLKTEKGLRTFLLNKKLIDPADAHQEKEGTL